MKWLNYAYEIPPVHHLVCDFAEGLSFMMEKHLILLFGLRGSELVTWSYAEFLLTFSVQTPKHWMYVPRFTQ